MTEYGSGIGLDRYWDIPIDPSGDVGSESGIDELQKDLSAIVGPALETGDGVETPESLQNGVVGEFIDDGVQTDVGILVPQLVDNDPRIESVVGADVGFDQSTGVLRVIVEAVPVEHDSSEQFSFVVEV
jgi:hypothetical protein